MRAPELRGRGWLNTGGAPLSSPACAARSCCSTSGPSAASTACTCSTSCAPLEERYGDVLVTIGVHSPKFEHEADADALVAAVERYEVDHPVLDDPELGPGRPTPRGPGRRSRWSTPRATSSPSCPARGTRTGSACCSTSSSPSTRPRARCTAATARTCRRRRRRRRCASRARWSRCPAGTFLVSDTAHHQLVELEADLVTERAPDRRRRARAGRRPPAAHGSASRRGCCCCRPTSRPGRLRRGRRRHRQPRAARAAARRRRGDARSPAPAASCASAPAADAAARRTSRRRGTSPGSTARWSSRWPAPTSSGRSTRSAEAASRCWPARAPRASATARAHDAWFAQPSGLAVSADGETLWVADSETSALRDVRRDVDGSRTRC